MAWLRLKHPPICVTTPNLVVPGLTVYAKVAENPQNWGLLGPRRCGMEGVADRPKAKLLPICVTTPNLVVFLLKQCIVLYRGQPQKLGSAGVPPLWDRDVADPFPICVTTSNLVVLRQVCTRKYKGTPKLGSAGPHPP